MPKATSGKNKKKGDKKKKSDTTVDTEVAPLGYHEKPPEGPDNTLAITQFTVDVTKEDGGAAAILSEVPKNKYSTLFEIGVGGMKKILRAKDRDTGRDVAMAAVRKKDPDNINRFIQEAKLAANLEHPNIVPVHDIGVKENGEPFFVMKLLGGENLAYIIDRLDDAHSEYAERFNLHARMRVFMKICDAIAFAHARGVAHLDLKPENVQIGDFGEVLVLDWGLAKIIAPSEQTTIQDANSVTETQNSSATSESIVERIGKHTVEYTVDGIVKGTPGYMAPEQVAGKNKEKDDVSDIYSLGAILYALLTFRKPVEGEDAREMMGNTLKGEITPPTKRSPEMHIPKSLEAVAMKALALHKKDRYHSVRDLSADVDAFLGGYATSAEKATLAKRFALVVKRHKALSASVAALFALAMAFGAYVAVEYTREWGKWTKTFSANFTSGTFPLKQLTFTDPKIKAPTHPWKITPKGMGMKEMEWLWLKDLDIRGDCQIVAVIVPNGSPAPFEISLNSDMEPLAKPNFSPKGYSLLFGAWNGRGDIVSKNLAPQPSDPTISAPSVYENGKKTRIVVTRKNGRISMAVNGRQSVSTIDYFPLNGKKLSKIGLRSHAPGTRLVTLNVYRWALPEQTSPLLAGDTLVEVKLPKEAVDKYRTIAEDAKSPAIAAKALLKAYVTASANNIPKQSETMTSLKKIMEKRFPKSEFQRELLEREILYLWEQEKFNDALDKTPELLASFPKSKVALKILQLPRNDIPDGVGQRLMNWIAKTKNVRSLNIADMKITSLKPLQGMEINALVCSRNPLENIAPLKGMPLQTLHCDSCRLSSLEPIKGMKIKDLIISGNKITDLEPLKGMPLERLRCRLNKISNLKPLENAPLKRLECGGNQIADLSPIKNAPLEFLGCRINKIKSLEPIGKMKILILDCQKNPLENIEPLAGMPLKELYINDCPIKDISPLQQCDALETLAIPKTTTNITFLKKLPALRRLDTKWNIPMKSAEDFWKQWDLEHSRNTHK